MAKVPRAVRLKPETVKRVKDLASSLGRSEQTVMESAIESFLDDAEHGTPDVPAEVPAVAKASPAPKLPPSVRTAADLLSDRQRKLAKEMGWVS